jgi:ATP-binding cassette subfamily F protein 3
MSLVVFEHVSLNLGGRSVLQDAGFRVSERQRIGVVGPNGSGKTTLLRLIAGVMQPDSGRVVVPQGTRVGYLPQDFELNSDTALLTYVLQSAPGKATLGEAIHASEQGLLDGALDEEQTMQVAERLADLHARLAHLDAEYAEHHARAILTGLGFRPSDYDRSLREFSGGWKMRALLASLLFQKPDVLLMDEPTNHLDMPSVGWLGGFLKQYRGAFLLICHDREFLNEQIDRVLALEPDGLRSYAGNYDAFCVQREEERTVLENRARNLAREREKTEQFIDRFRAKASKASQVQSRVRALEKMQTVTVSQARKTIGFRFPPCTRSGDQVLRLEHVGKAYGDHTVLHDVNLTVRRSERIGLIGVNGAGKTTLLRMLAGELDVTRGAIHLGHNVQPSYYAQHHTEILNPADTIYDAVYAAKPDATITQVRTLLGAMLFSNDDVEKRISVLSGGERARVALARILIHCGNLLLMDEPTNHLDLDSSEALTEALQSYDGTLLFVSHNRRFIRTLATTIWNVADGTVVQYPGTLDEYLAQQSSPLTETASPANTASTSRGGSAAPRARETSPPRTTPRAQSQKRPDAEHRRRQKHIAELEQRIAQLERDQQARRAVLEDQSTYDDHERAMRLAHEFAEINQALEDVTEEWMRLQESE